MGKSFQKPRKGTSVPWGAHSAEPAPTDIPPCSLLGGFHPRLQGDLDPSKHRSQRFWSEGHVHGQTPGQRSRAVGSGSRVSDTPLRKLSIGPAGHIPYQSCRSWHFFRRPTPGWLCKREAQSFCKSKHRWPTHTHLGTHLWAHKHMCTQHTGPRHTCTQDRHGDRAKQARHTHRLGHA